jgi:NADH-quinone oxidoreductase subunit M
VSARARRAFLVIAALLAVVLGAFVLSGPRVAYAHMGEEKFRIERRVVRPPDGPRGQIEIRTGAPFAPVRLLRNDKGEYVGSFEIANTGPGPLTISRVYLAGAEDDPRSAPGLSAVYEGNTRAPLAPGSSRRYDVTWKSDQARVIELYATLVVESDAAQPDADTIDPPKLVGIVATRRLGLARWLPSLLVLFPLALLLAAAIGRFAGSRRVGKLAAMVVVTANLGAAMWMFFSINPELGRRDGNEGLQFIQRFALDRASGVEWFVGIDGWSHGLVAVVAVVVFAGVMLVDPSHPGWARVTGAIGAVAAGATLALVGQTTILFVAGVAVAGIGASLLVWDARDRSASLHVALATLVSVIFLGWATVRLAELSGSTFLLDGSPTARTYALGDIARARLVTHVEPMLGLPAYRAVWLLTFAGCAPFLPLIPLHGWLRATASSRSAGALVAVAILPAIAGYGVLRLGVAMQPDGARWAAQSLPIVGVVLLVLGAAFALAERDIRRLPAGLAAARAGALLLFAFSLTPEGVDGALGLVVGQPIALALVVLGAQAAYDRVRDTSVRRVSGLAESAPLLATTLVVGALTLGAMLLPGMSASLVGFVGSFGRNPVLTIVGAVGLVLLVIAGSRVLRGAFGAQPKAWETNKYLEPFGGAPPDLRAREIAAAVPLLLLLIELAAAPRPFTSSADRTIRDLWPALDSPGPTQVL